MNDASPCGEQPEDLWRRVELPRSEDTELPKTHTVPYLLVHEFSARLKVHLFHDVTVILWRFELKTYLGIL